MMNDKRTLPEIQERLQDIALELSSLAVEISRRKPIRKAPAKAKKITPEHAAAIKRYAEYNPEASYQDMSYMFNVNIGRISEILSGKKSYE